MIRNCTHETSTIWLLSKTLMMAKLDAMPKGMGVVSQGPTPR